MPKNRNQKRGKRKVKRRLFIVCEGKKTEPNYLNGFLKDCNFRGKPVEVRVVKVEKNTAKELVEKADAIREIPGDEVWANLPPITDYTVTSFNISIGRPK